MFPIFFSPNPILSSQQTVSPARRQSQTAAYVIAHHHLPDPRYSSRLAPPPVSSVWPSEKPSLRSSLQDIIRSLNPGRGSAFAGLDMTILRVGDRQKGFTSSWVALRHSHD